MTRPGGQPVGIGVPYASQFPYPNCWNLRDPDVYPDDALPSLIHPERDRMAIPNSTKKSMQQRQLLCADNFQLINSGRACQRWSEK